MTERALILAVGMLIPVLGGFLESKCPAEPKRPFIHYSSRCLTEVAIKDDTYLEIPLVDGRPDKSHAVMYHVSATYESECGVIILK